MALRVQNLCEIKDDNSVSENLLLSLLYVHGTYQLSEKLYY